MCWLLTVFAFNNFAVWYQCHEEWCLRFCGKCKHDIIQQNTCHKWRKERQWRDRKSTRATKLLSKMFRCIQLCSKKCHTSQLGYSLACVYISGELSIFFIIECLNMKISWCTLRKMEQFHFHSHYLYNLKI